MSFWKFSRDTKPPSFDGPYKHPLPNLNTDPWAVLLAPELEADRLRCEAWKDEVQNLLIFAGLFSAVVTSFVIDSYKSLLPDSNETVAGLLFHIANTLNSSSQNSTPFPPSVDPASITTPFSQSRSSVVITGLWLISLILSLTVVLIGTITLQWLREHHSYPGYSSKEILTILHMRLEAIEAWRVPLIFASLPVLLQFALILFFIGLIYFALLLGSGISIIVSIFVGITFFFYIASTSLPTLQMLSFLTGPYPKTIPNPCAYKSPQSQFFRSIIETILRLLSIAHCIRYLPKNSNGNQATRDGILPPDRHHLIPNIYKIWYRKPWSVLDKAWLSLRDACHQRLFDTDPDLYIHRKTWKEAFPLSDVTAYLAQTVRQAATAKHTDTFLTAIYLGFQELSNSIWCNRHHTRDDSRIDRRVDYFERLHNLQGNVCPTFRLLAHGGNYNFARFSEHSHILNRLVNKHFSAFHQEQTFWFLDLLVRKHPSSALAAHHRELGLRILQYMMKEDIAFLTPIPNSFQATTLFTSYPFQSWIKHVDHAGNVGIFSSFFESISKAVIHHSPLKNPSESHKSAVTLYTHPQIRMFLKSLAFNIEDYLSVKWSSYANTIPLEGINNDYSRSFKLMAEHLNSQMGHSKPPHERIPSPLFYFSSILMQFLVQKGGKAQDILQDKESTISATTVFKTTFKTLFETLRKYKVWTSGTKDDFIERQLKGDDRCWNIEGDPAYLKRFSDEWWVALFDPGFERSVS